MAQKAQPLQPGPRADLEFNLHLRRRSGTPLQAQLADQLREAIRAGRLEAGNRIPSSRRLAEVLRLDRNLVVIAFETLLSEGYLVARRGSGTFVTSERLSAETPVRHTSRGSHRWAKNAGLALQPESPAPEGTITFALGRPSVTELDSAAWRGVWRHVATVAPLGDYADAQGSLELRVAVAQYLGRARSVRCDASDVIITSGTTQAAHLIAQATLRSGDAVAFEEPGYRWVRQIFQSYTERMLAVPVDDDGLTVERLPTGKAAPLLVYCTPSHQYPLGSRLSIPRRLALLEWARSEDALILEDDYDGEFRFETTPLPALAALGRDCTVYLGTFSKTMDPSLRVGFLVAPPVLRDHLIECKARSDAHTSLPVQVALARFIGDGHFERHIRRMRRVYASKRQALLESLEPIRQIAPLKGLEAGLHAHLELPPTMPAERVAARAKAYGVTVGTLEPYFHDQPVVNGLLLGYGGLSLEDIRVGAATLARVILELA